ncbi:MAG: M42 family metallopeptidase [Firmicutes bacterium]|nr:M42 family metallopeptidase [Bacillota bacterium]
MISLLERLTQTDGVSGNEDAVRDIIKNEIEKYCDDVTVDAMGNIIAHKSGTGKKIMLAAHMDEIGVIVTFIDDKGFLRFAPVGGLYIRDLTCRRVRFANGTVGVIGCEDDEKKPELKKLYIDIGAKNAKDAQKRVSVGDTAAFVGGYHKSRDTIVSKALDNRVGCYVALESAKRLKESAADMYYVFTTQEEVGLRGAKTAAYTVAPDYAIALDVTDTGDTPEAPKMPVKLGGGAAIKVMDRSVLCDADIRETMRAAAQKDGILYQLEIMTDGGTDAGAIHLSRGGVKTGGISVPARYIHSPSEMVSDKDVKACIALAVSTAQMLSGQ